MGKDRITKKELLSSIAVLILCFSMLLGSTYAWFTDSESSNVNTIMTGNLQMEISYKPFGSKYTDIEIGLNAMAIQAAKD